MFSIVLPATGTHAWDITEGWVHALQRLNLLKRTFRPNAAWDDLTPSDDDGLLEFLRNNKEDYLILLGIDWHSQPLHHGEIYELLCERFTKNIGVIWEDYAIHDGLLDDLKSKMLNAWSRAAHTASTFITNHETNIDTLMHTIDSSRIHYIGFGVDTSRYLHSLTPFSKRENAICFSGKVSMWEQETNGGPYALRRKIIDSLERQSISLSIRDGNMSHSEYVDFMLKSKICLNLPSFSLSPTLRNYEALCAGCALITWEGKGDKAMHELYRFPNVFVYDPANTEDAANKCREALQLRIDYLEEVASDSLSMAQSTLSHEARIFRLIEIVNSRRSFLLGQADIQIEKHEKLQTIENKKPKLVVDLVFHQIALNGIAQVWDSIILSYIEMYGADSIILIDRTPFVEKNYGCRIIDAPKIDWGSEPAQVAEANRILLQEHSIGAYLFASTYYTTAAGGQTNAQIIHDMIPEILCGDEDVWNHKRHSIGKSDLLLCVSRSTYLDLIGSSPSLISKSTYIRNGLPCSRMHSAQNIKTDNDAGTSKMKTGRSSPAFTILYIGGRFGWKGYKNAAVLFRALTLYCTQYANEEPPKLICVSHWPDPEKQILPFTDKINVDFRTANDKELRQLYETCDCLVYSSAIEGFGLPILEGLYEGIQVIASDIMPHREASLGYWEDVMFFNTFSPISLCKALRKAYCNKQDKISCDALSARRHKIEAVSIERWRAMATTLHSIINSKADCTSSNPTFLQKTSDFARASFRYSQNTLPSKIQQIWEHKPVGHQRQSPE